jgi:N-acetylglutamate synthase-like GNAT family acetyltransferase
LQIRSARAEDVDPICDAIRRSIAELCVEDHKERDDILSAWLANKTPENIRHWITAPLQLTVVVEIDGNIAGVGQVSSDGKILLNYVSPDFRFRGVSKAVMLACPMSISAIGSKARGRCSTRSVSSRKSILVHAAGNGLKATA